MAKTFHLIVTSVDGAKFDGDVVSATIPGSSGEMTILADHEPLVSTLRKGKIIARSVSGSQEFKIEKGVMECSGKVVTILL